MKIIKSNLHYTLIPTVTLYFYDLKVRISFGFYKYILEWNIKRKCKECKNGEGEIYPDYKMPYDKLNYFCENCDKLIREATEKETQEYEESLKKMYEED